MNVAHHLLLGLGGAIVCVASLVAQPQQFQFVVSATDASGNPVAGLTPDDMVVSESGVRVAVSKVDRFAIPLKITITVDNGSDSVDALGHIRTGLKEFVETLPHDVEVTLISTSPQPRTVIRATTDRAQILRGVTLIAPESEQRPRFTDALVEFGQRLRREERDLKSGKIKPYTPVLVMVSTAASEQTSYQLNEIQNAMSTIIGHRARVFVVIMTTKVGDADLAPDLDRNRQTTIGRPIAAASHGRFETLATSLRLQTLLPEWGTLLASLHRRQSSQFLITVERASSGPLQDPLIDVRNDLRAIVTTDGVLVE